MVFDGIILGLIVGFIRSGFKRGFNGLASMKLKAGWIFPVLLAVHVILYLTQRQSEWVTANSGYLFMTVYVAILIFLGINYRQHGFIILFFGVFLNFLVMVTNGGKMPVAREMVQLTDATQVSILEKGTSGTKHMLMTETTKFPMLADVIPITAPYPIPQVISVGDILMNVGIFLFIVYLLSGKNKKLAK